MRFIYSLNEDVSKDLETAGLKKIGEVMIDGKKATLFENNKNTYLSKYAKNEIILSNKLFF